MIKLIYPRQRIFIAFLVYTLLSFAVATLSFWLFRRVESINLLADEVHKLHTRIHNLSKLQSDFLLNEPSNELFYKTGNSPFLKEYVINQAQILNSIGFIKKSPQAKKWNMTKSLDSLQSDLKSSTDMMKELARKIRLRGYKNYGLEGVMREYGRVLESQADINNDLVLQLRRHEKNFINRLDTISLKKWKYHFEDLTKEIIEHKNYKLEEKYKYLSYLDAYKNAFYHFVKIDNDIGYGQKIGFAAKTNQKAQVILKQIDKLDTHSQNKKDSILNQLRFITVILVTTSVIASMLLSLSFPYIMKI
ncbi:hypothetical protein Fleli_0652 [Bernardetia litoralis DSM 6794]|uniref:Nitrate/nitrite sensing protein domain-containing protein n=1 Tax=Bernardetia litoralis (strain ATCC 23117 / DSM 6794 / NBRC 15988 / NCIMB 1366 / Fx l1 / Sio-4) TaxID=880071 RepID=I4AGN0_BERLS|nr:hypothetical protein [Bernardetia litoralis]AFM03115.1 hypothetical protein Fleli_0652 [Bernardetia litoralis DSM 6794]